MDQYFGTHIPKMNEFSQLAIYPYENKTDFMLLNNRFQVRNKTILKTNFKYLRR